MARATDGRGAPGWLRRILGTSAAKQDDPPPPRMGGGRRLLCIGPDPAALSDLADLLEQELPDLDVISAPTAGDAPAGAVAPPFEPGRRSAARWLATLAPDLVLRAGPIGPDPLLEALIEAPAPVIAVDVTAPEGQGAHGRRVWRSLLSGLARVLARDPEAARALRQLGPAGMRIEVAGPFVPVPAPPRCDEPDRDHYAHILHARPAWLAAFPTEAEIGPVIDAHSFALQGAHRLLLLVAPRDDAAGPALAERFRGEGWRVARYGAGEEPDHGTEIFVVDSREEIGLWYRLAPICVIGGTFRPDAVGAADPADAARLGSAILAGPVQAPHEAFFGRLAAAGGIARLEAPGDLGPALSDLLAPDKTAALAQPAWDVASDGARVQERIVAAIRDVLRDGGPG